MNSMRIGWCFSLSIHALAFGVLGYAGFFRHPAELAGDDEKQLITFTLVTAPDDSVVSPAIVKPKPPVIVLAKPPEPPKPSQPAEPANPPVEQQAVQNELASPAPIANETEPPPAAPPPASPIAIALAKPPTPSRAASATDPQPRDENVSVHHETINARAQPNYRNNPAPIYPSSALRRHEEGLVSLRVLVSAEGQPKRIEVKQSCGLDR